MRVGLPALFLHTTGIAYQQPPPTITGFAYPLETLTASRAGQWAIDGAPVIGQTAATFQVPLLAYGRTVTCDNSAPVVVWKPWDIAGVVSVRVADRRVLRGVSPDVVAVNGDTIRRWNGLVSNQPADQTNSAFQPIWRSAGQSGNPSVEFDGVDDRLLLGGSEADVFRNVGTGYIIAGARDTNPNGGNPFHNICSFAESGTNTPRFGIVARDNTTSRFYIYASTGVTPTTTSSANIASNSNYNVHTAEALFSSALLRHRVNGSQVAQASLPNSNNTPNTANTGAIASYATGADRFPGHICCVIFANQVLTATDRSRLERFAGLFGGLNIPLV